MSSGEAAPPAAEPAPGPDSRLEDICKGLGFGEGVLVEAKDVLREAGDKLLVSPFSTRSPELDRSGYAFIVYCIAKLLPGDAKAQLKHILKGCNVKIDDFTMEALCIAPKLDQVFRRRYGSDWVERVQLKQLEKTVEILAASSKFYRKAYMDSFSIKDSGDLQSTSCSSDLSEFYRFGWLLFLLLRSGHPEQFKDLVSCIHGIVAVLAILILHVPATYRNSSFHESLQFGKIPNDSIDLIASLSQKYHSAEDRLKEMIKKANDIVLFVLNKKSTNLLAHTDITGQINKADIMLFEDLLDVKSVKLDIRLLESQYDSVSTEAELDERIFAADIEHLNSNGVGSTKCSNETLASPARVLKSPCIPSSPTSMKHCQIVQMTPVSSSMTTAKWLRECIAPLGEAPSPELQQHLSSCDRDLNSVVTCRANIILEAIFPSQSLGRNSASRRRNLANTFDTVWAKERKSEASKLYYRVLQTICKAEQMRGEHNLTSLLSNERFHRCLLACIAELVLATHKTVIMMLPTVLETAGITAFDLSKVIESVVRHEETLPRELKRHLNSLEEQLLESIAWEKGSSLYNSLLVAQPHLAVEINRLGLLADPMPSLDEIASRNDICMEDWPSLVSRKRVASLDMNSNDRFLKKARTESSCALSEKGLSTPPAKSKPLFNNLQLHSTFASPALPNPTGGSHKCADIGIKIFFSKILKLGAIRIRNLNERLHLPELTAPAFSLFEQILNQKTELLFNRHIDQIILCCVYGAAKVHKLNLVFKELVNNYKKLPQCKPEVYKSVFFFASASSCRDGFEIQHLDIITFYNKVFVPSAKELLVRTPSLGSSTDNRNNESPKSTFFSSLPDMSPKKVSPSHNVYVSPLRQSKMDVLLSPSSRSFYACLGEGTRAYRSPSADLVNINSCLKSPTRRINQRLVFDVISDSMVARSLGPQNGSTAPADTKPVLDVPTNRQELLE